MYGFTMYSLGIMTRHGSLVFVKIDRPAGMTDETWFKLADGLCRILNRENPC